DEQVRGAVHQQEAQVAPAVAEARQLGLAAARPVLDRQLADREARLRRAHEHLRGELHAQRPQLEAPHGVAANGTHPAVRVAPAAAASSPLPSWDALSTTITSPRSDASTSVSRASLTQRSMLSASLRHGITTETDGTASRLGFAGAATPVCSVALIGRAAAIV